MNVPHFLGALVVEHSDLLVLDVLLDLLDPLEADGGGGDDQSGPGGNFLCLHPTVGADIFAPENIY